MVACSRRFQRIRYRLPCGKNPFHYDFKHDYSADGIKRSIEDSLERTGLPYFDIIDVHDLSEDQVGDRYPYFVKQAQDGAFKVLSALRDEGVIKAWEWGSIKLNQF
ncbi:aldo/keto reductase [Chryseobacterium scophthalmum]|uniref:aldo/keto reductase n=1 Tax=Chryseobacterium scophthalmum TaxID=59733 RepID=UPI003D7C2E6A